VKLKDLSDAVRAVTEPVFTYDINYIEENMNVTNVLSPSDEKVVTPTKDRTLGGPRSPPVVPTQPTQRLLLPTASFSSHKNTIFALAYDDVHDRIMSAGKDGLVMVWGKAGVPEQEITLARHYACAMDFNGRYSSLFVGGVAKEPSVQPALFHYTSDNKGRWELRGTLERPGRLVSCVKALIHDSRANHLVAGESCKPEQKHSISVYDVSSGLFEKLQPLMSYEEHSDIITSIAQVGGSEGLFFSASRDCSIKLWDLRQRSSSGAFSSPKGVGHDAMITCLDVQERLLLSAGLDKRVCAWDLRMLGNSGGAISAPMQFFAVDSSPVLKVAICPAAPNFAAVSTLESFRLLKLDSGVSDLALPFKDGRARGRYHDLRWNGTSDILYASGEGMQVDVYQFI
jgi:WD40 repeat protein